MRSFLLSFFFLITVIKVYAQRSSDSIVLKEIIITENRLEIPFSSSSRDINIIDKKTLQSLPVQSVSEALSYLPGVDVRQRGVDGVQADISIRGGTFDQTLVLINGMKLTDPQTGHLMMNLPLSLENISEIVVLKGPGSRIYGQNAFSGVVNIITKVPDEKFILVKGHGGDFGTYGAHISFSLPDRKYRQYLSLSRDASTGYRYNTDYSINNVFYQSELDLNKGTLNFLGGYTNRRFGANGFYGNATYTQQWEGDKTSFLNLGYTKKYGKTTFKPRVYWRRNHDDYILVKSNPSLYHNKHTTNVTGIELNTKIDNRLGSMGLGIEARDEAIVSSNLDSHQRRNIGIYAEQKVFVAKIDFTPGVYVNWYDHYGWNAFPGIDAGYNLTSNIRLYANVGRSYRLPTYTDLFYKSPVQLGDPSLRPEESITYEAGTRYTLSGITAEINYFYQDANRLIDWVKSSSLDTLRAVNISNIKKNGVEISVRVDPSKMTGSPFFINHISLSYNYILEKYNYPENLTSLYALQSLKHQLIFGVGHKIYKNINNSLIIRYIQRIDTSPYWLVDSRLSWNNPLFTIFAEATNITNTSYVEVMTPMPGRWFRAGLSYKLQMR
jgi:vitamin B12 transporter